MQRRYKKVSSKKLKLESQLAASMLYYDIEEFKKFISLWVEVENDPDFEVSGIFNTFVTAMREIMVEENEDRLNKDFILASLRNYNMNEPNKTKAEKFDAWLDEVASDNNAENFRLGEELFYNYAWEVFKESVEKIDRMDVPFKEKLLIEPIRVDYTEIDKIFMKPSDPVSTKSTKGFITTGVEALDDYVKPEFSNLMVIAARPSVGKSTMLLKQAFENAKKGIKVLFISLEMTQRQIYRKLYSWYKKRSVLEEEYEQVRQEPGFQKIDENLTFVINYSNNGEALLDIMKTSIKKHGTQIICLDYLQLVRFSGLDEWGSIRKCTNSLKNLATSENVFVSTCSQVSRDSENYGIELSSMYGGSSIEADSDIVVSIERNDRDLMNNSIKKGTISILKNRDGVSDPKVNVMIDYVAIQFSKIGMGA